MWIDDKEGLPLPAIQHEVDWRVEGANARHLTVKVSEKKAQVLAALGFKY